MPILWNPPIEARQPQRPMRRVSVSASDWARAGRARHENHRRTLVARNDARRETRHTEGGAMTNEQMIEWSARVVAVAVFAGILWLVTR